MSTQVDSREVASSPVVQGVHESRAYAFDFNRSAFHPTGNAGTVAVYDWSVDPPLDRSAALLTETTATVNGNVATMDGLLHSLEDGVEYRLFCRGSDSEGQTGETYIRVFGVT